MKQGWFACITPLLLAVQLTSLQAFAGTRLWSSHIPTVTVFSSTQQYASLLVEDISTVVPVLNDTTPTSPITLEVSDNSEEFTATAAAATTIFRTSSSSRSTNVVDLWKRRLITHEDSFSIHKLTSIGYSLSSAILLGTAATRYAESPDLFAVIPPEMEAIANVFTLSNIIMCAASVRMAFIHRQGDLTARNAFLGTAVSSVFSGFFMVWISPFAVADVFNNVWVSRGCFAVLVGLNVFFISDTILASEEIVEGRRDRKGEDYRGRKIVDLLGYVFPVAWGMPLILSTGLIACVMHDRPWFLEQCQFVDEQLGYAGMQSHIFYQQLSTSLAASYASLFVTLRDKKLISKTQELVGITLFATPALIWSIYTTWIFPQYLFVPH